MNHLTLGHFLYVVAAIDTLLGIVTLMSLRKAPPPPALDGAPGAQSNRLFIVAAIFVSAIGLVLIGTFLPAAQQPIF